MSHFFKRTWSAIFLASALLSGAGAGPLYAASHERHDHAPAAKYYCPMHPQVVSDKPGDCPICHMRLVRDEFVSGPGQAVLDGRMAVKINQPARDRVGIRTETVRTKPLKKTVRAWGMVAHDAELYQLQIEFLREERLNYEKVRDRTPVALKRGLTDQEKIRLRFLEKGLSAEWVKALEEAGVPDKRLIYHEDAPGVWVYVQLRENDAALVKPGDEVTLRPTAGAETAIKGELRFIDELVSEDTRTVRAHVLVDGMPAALKPNTSVSASIEADLGESLVVSEDAPLFAGSRSLVFVDRADTFTPREVVLGERADGFYQVKSGLMEGEKVASSGNFFIDSESKLRSSIAAASHGSHAS